MSIGSAMFGSLDNGETQMRATITSQPITVIKTRAVADELAATIAADDADVKVAVVERQDGRFVVELREAETGNFLGCV